MLLCCCLNYLTEVQKLVALFAIEEIRQALAPAIFEFNEYLDELVVILQLWVDYLDVLLVFTEEAFKVLVDLLNALG